MVSRLIGIGTSWPSTWREHAVLVGPPRGELREVVQTRSAVGVEDVRPVAVDQEAVVVVLVVGVAADVRPVVDEENALAELGSQALGKNGPGETGPDDEVIEHERREVMARPKTARENGQKNGVAT